MSAINATYRVGAFAALAGVTVRALHHYDRVGLLRPKRGAGGYRVYSARDLERLEQIVVLRFLGIPLRQIGGMLSASPTSLAASLRAQRGTLAKRRQLLDVAIAAIGDLENAVATGATAEPQLFKRIIEVIDMQTDPRAATKQYEELVVKKVERLQALSPEALADLRSRWTALVMDIKGALTEDPASATAQAFGVRWTDLLGQLMGQPVDPGTLSVHQQTHEWDTRMASFVDRSVWEFMTRVLAARR
jgi:DNA-binding transcriptional MerR regulator